MKLNRYAGALVFVFGSIAFLPGFAHAATFAVSLQSVASQADAQASPAPGDTSSGPSPAPALPFSTYDFGAALLPFEYNAGALSHGTTLLPSPVLDFNATFFRQKLLFHEEYRQEGFIHYSSTIPTAGGGTTFVPEFAAREYTIEERLGVGVPHLPGVFGGVAVFYHPSNYGFPILVGGGIGLETSPDLRSDSPMFGRLYFYPNVTNEHGFFDKSSHRPLNFRYSIFRGQADYAHRLGKSDLFLHAAVEAEHWTNLGEGPANLFRIGPTAGLMLKL